MGFNSGFKGLREANGRRLLYSILLVLRHIREPYCVWPSGRLAAPLIDFSLDRIPFFTFSRTLQTHTHFLRTRVTNSKFFILATSTWYFCWSTLYKFQKFQSSNYFTLQPLTGCEISMLISLSSHRCLNLSSRKHM